VSDRSPRPTEHHTWMGFLCFRDIRNFEYNIIFYFPSLRDERRTFLAAAVRRYTYYTRDDDYKVFFLYNIYIQHVEHVCINIISYNDIYTFFYAHNAVVHEHDYYSIRILLKWKKIRQLARRTSVARPGEGRRPACTHIAVDRTIQFTIIIIWILTRRPNQRDVGVWWPHMVVWGGGSN